MYVVLGQKARSGRQHHRTRDTGQQAVVFEDDEGGEEVMAKRLKRKTNEKKIPDKIKREIGKEIPANLQTICHTRVRHA